MLGSEIIDGWIFNFFFFYLFSIRQLIQALAERVITIFQLTEVKERIIIGKVLTLLAPISLANNITYI